MNCLGVDFGTTSVKGVLFDEKLNELASLKIDYSLNVSGNRVELEAEKYPEMLFEILDKMSACHKIDCLAIDTQCETMILADEEGNPLRDAIVWLDNRAEKEAELIDKKFGRKKVYEITGQPEITATWPASKLLWVRENEPEVFAKTKKIFLLEDYLLFKLTGKFVTEKTLQSSSLYLDINKGDWWDEMLDFTGITREMLPKLEDSGVLAGEYKGIKVVTSAMDQGAGAIAAGVTGKGKISEMTGTTMAIYFPTDAVPEFDENSIIPCHLSYDGSYVLLSWSPTAGMALKWFRESFLKDKSFAQIDEMAEKIEPGCNGLVFLPYLCGSTMPKYNPDARGSFTGLTPEHTSAHFARSIMEAVSFMLKGNLEYMNIPVDEIRVMGGGALSDLWCSMKADITGKNIVTLKNKETACLGSAILAGVGSGVFESVEDGCKNIGTDKTYKPTGRDYTKAYEEFMKYDSILNIRKGE